MQPASFRKDRHRIFIGAFFFSFHLALVSYINSSFLERSFSSTAVQWLFIAASVCSLTFLFIEPYIIQKIGITRTTIFALLLSVLSLWTIGNHAQGAFLAGAFILYFSLNSTLLSLLDVTLEHYSPPTQMGNIRGFYLMLTNAAWVVAALCNTKLLALLPLSSLYLIGGGLSLVTLFFIRSFSFRLHTGKYQQFSLKDAFHTLFQTPKYRFIYSTAGALQFFYAGMVIFSIPLLHQYFSFARIAMLLSIMLLPFVLFQYLFGKINDRYHNHRFLIGMSFFLMATMTCFFPYIVRTGSFPLVALVLFLSRVGASIAEVSIESYFFRTVHEKDTAAIAMFRGWVPLAYILVPLVGIVVKAHVEYIFFGIGTLLFMLSFRSQTQVGAAILP